MARELLTHITSYLFRKISARAPVSSADQLLIKKTKGRFMRPLGFLFSDSDKRGGAAIFGVEIASAETISER
jgi:hypothetical protein